MEPHAWHRHAPPPPEEGANRIFQVLHEWVGLGLLANCAGESNFALTKENFEDIVYKGKDYKPGWRDRFHKPGTIVNKPAFIKFQAPL